MKSVSEDAQELLFDLELYQIPVNPITVCDRLGIIYDEKPYEGFDGTLMISQQGQLIGINSNIVEQTRKSFTCAHEIGHYCYDIDEKQTFTCTRDDTGYGRQKMDEKEIRANEFASELLMPTKLFLQEIRNQDPSWSLIELLSKKFETSLQATATKFIKMSPHLCWLVIVKNGKLQRYVKGDHNEFPINLKNTFSIIRKSVDDWIPSPADNWIYTNRRTNGKEILCWPLKSNNYGDSLILLWDDENSLINDCYEEQDESEEFDEYYKW